MSTDLTTQRKAHKFFSGRLHDQREFSKDELRVAAGWSENSLKTYWSKQFRGFVERSGPHKYRVRENFRPYLNWGKFRQEVVTQVRRVATDYKLEIFDKLIIYEFYLPLTHESALRLTLDSLFFKDAVLARLHRIGVGELKRLFGRMSGETDKAFFERVCSFIGEKFGGYSVYHVNGRFRGQPLLTRDDALKLESTGERYLVNETTALTRFIFPCKDGDSGKIAFLFRELFTRAITQLINGEDEIWMVESGMHNRIHIWKPK